MTTSTKNTVKVFLDTDVAYDLVSGRHPFFGEAEFIIPLAKRGMIEMLVSAGSITNMFYFAYEKDKFRDATVRLFDLLKYCDIANTTQAIVLASLHSEFSDKEDAYQYFTAFDAQAAYFLTRNLKDYKTTSSILPVLTPAQFIHLLN